MIPGVIETGCKSIVFIQYHNIYLKHLVIFFL
jgi:hypothetical protein